MEINYIVILVALAFLGFLAFKEINRADKSRLMARLVANLVMVTGFALLIIPISYKVHKEVAIGELNFFTEKENAFGDLFYHLKAHPEIKKINIYGYGLPDEELKKLKGYQLTFHPSAIPAGILSASWPKKIKQGQRLTLQGIYHNPTNKTVNLKLWGLGTTLDSLAIKANTKVKFSFANVPKQQGKAVFRLLCLQDKDTLAVEPVPFEVEPKQPISILILAASPDFEYNFLKKWLFENQFQVAFRSLISKNKFSTEFLNRKEVNLNQINQALLNNIDVAIIDEQELTPQLLSAVTNGMGLIVRTKTLKTLPDNVPLLYDTAKKVSVNARLSGMGRIVTTTIPSTFQWQLAGKGEAYSEFWSLLLNNALRRKIEQSSYSLSSQWPTVYQKERITISSSATKSPQIAINGAGIAPRQNMELPFVWDGVFWPKNTGWHALSFNQKTENIYIYQKTDWRAAKNFEKLSATAYFVNNQQKSGFNEKNLGDVVKQEVSKWWFFAMFFISISFLWYEKRFLAIK